MVLKCSTTQLKTDDWNTGVAIARSHYIILNTLTSKHLQEAIVFPSHLLNISI